MAYRYPPYPSCSQCLIANIEHQHKPARSPVVYKASILAAWTPRVTVDSIPVPLRYPTLLALALHSL